MLDSIFNTATDTTATDITVTGLLIAMASALGLGIMISIIYMLTNKNKSPSQSFALTLVLLPGVVTVIILLVGSNIARAFSLAGAFSIIRFRSAPGNSKDIAYVLFTMAVGLACGMGYIIYAAIVGVVLCAVVAFLELMHFGQQRSTQKIIKITIPENLNYQDAFDGVMKKYTSLYSLEKVKTADLGSLYELVYNVTTRDSLSEKDFIDELRCRNGNLNITLILGARNEEY